MNIIPLMRCSDVHRSVAFYRGILDFELLGIWPDKGDPAFAVLVREGAELHLSSHSGDGTFGNVAAIVVDDIDELFGKYIERGLDTSLKKESPVHKGPLDQTWGTREFYVDDPDGNTIRFIKR